MYEQVPEELKRLRQWVCYRVVPDEGRPGKMKKVPVNPKTGGMAMSNNPGTWADFDEAVRGSQRFSGIGFMFAGGYFGVDIDNADAAIADYKAGGTDNIVAEFIHALASYAEYSLSGRGIHVICRGALPPGGRRRGNVEMYDSARFFVVTGNAAGGYAAIADCGEKIKCLHEKYIGGGHAAASGAGKAAPRAAPPDVSDDQIIRLAQSSKKGQMVSDLYAGRWQGHFPSQSEADMALCSILAFYTRRDEKAVDRLFRLSGLMRDKWDRKQAGSTYGALTISKAIRSIKKVYEIREHYAVRIGPGEEEATPAEKTAGKRYTFDDTGNADRFYDRFGASVLYNYTAKKWMHFDGRRWAMDESGEVRRMADEIAEDMQRGLGDYLKSLGPQADIPAVQKEYLRHVRFTRSSKAKTNMLIEAQHKVPVNTGQLDQDPYLMCVSNGELDLKTGALQPHDRAHLLAKIAPTEYLQNARHPMWDRFLNDIFAGDQALIRYIQKAVGYSLTGFTGEHCVFFLYGTGRNGKSTFLDILTQLLGEYAINIQPESIMQRPAGGATSDIARLKAARLCTASEPGEGARLNEGLIKQLTGGDKVTAAAKYENEFEFTPEFKLWMSTNHKPCIRGTDLGVWSRIHLIPFDVQIEEHNMDRQLKSKLQRELPGILSWAVTGCLSWQREGLKPPEKVAAAGREYRTEMDVLAAFLTECCEAGGEAPAGELFRAYAAWAREGNEFEISATKFGREMQKRYEKRKSSGMVYAGLHLRAAYKPDHTDRVV